MQVNQSDPDAHLLQDMQRGEMDEATWRDFVGRIRRWIGHKYPFLYAQADELAGEAAICTLESIHSFRGEAHFIRWVHGIAHHIVSRHLHKQGGVVVLSFEEIREELMADDEIGKHLLHLAAEAAMQALTDQERRVFVLRVTHDMDHKEIAQRLGISDNASRQTWMRAAEKIGRYRRENQW